MIRIRWLVRRLLFLFKRLGPFGGFGVSVQGVLVLLGEREGVGTGGFMTGVAVIGAIGQAFELRELIAGRLLGGEKSFERRVAAMEAAHEVRMRADTGEGREKGAEVLSSAVGADFDRKSSLKFELCGGDKCAETPGALLPLRHNWGCRFQIGGGEG
jgi:hypothetical protein